MRTCLFPRTAPRMATCLCVLLCGSLAVAQTASDWVTAEDGWDQEFQEPAVASELTAMQEEPDEPEQPEQPEQPVQPEQPTISTQTPAQTAELPSLFGGFGTILVAEQQRQAAIETAPAVSVVSGVESETRNTTEAGDLLSKSYSSPGLYFQRRNPITISPYIRGYGVGQYITQLNGGYWFPARQDLDTALSKIDSASIQDIIVIKGPYSAMYGPGFSFFDIVTQAPPRCRNPYMEATTALNYSTNGDQWYGRQTVSRGGPNSGFRLGYGHRTASDYEVGSDNFIFQNTGDRIPSSYKSRNIDSAWGYDLDSDTHLDVTGLRIEQTDVEFPGQVFDIDYLETDGYTGRLVMENRSGFDRLLLQTWYNRTRFEGNSLRTGKLAQIPALGQRSAANPRGVGFLGFTDVDQMSTGYRSAVSWGDPTWAQLTVGTDWRYQEMELNELDIFSFDPGVTSLAQRPFNFPIPRSHASNPGLFEETLLPINDRLSVKTGGRLDWVSNNADGFADKDLNGLPDVRFLPTSELDRDYFLAAGFATAQYEINREWSATAGYGYAERAPTLTESYSNQPFLQVFQNPFDFVEGNPNLDEERLNQFDVGLNANFQDYRGGVHGFYAFVDDYISYQLVSTGSTVGTFSNPFAGFEYINVQEATLSGGEIYGELDYNNYWTMFGVMSYVEGRNHDINAPLPSFYPLQSYMGVRLNPTRRNPRWGMEWAARVVAQQDRLGTVVTPTGGSFLVEDETAGFATYDMRGYYRIGPQATLTAGVLNFTDKFYQEHLDPRYSAPAGVTNRGVFQPGRNFYFGCDLRY